MIKKSVLKECKIKDCLPRFVCVTIPLISIVSHIIPEGRVFCALLVGFLASLCMLFWHASKLRGGLTLIDILFSLYIIYRILNQHSPFDIVAFVYLLVGCCLWFCFRQVNSTGLFKWLLGGLVFSATIQSLVAIFQWCGLLESLHASIRVTGCFGNSGPLGCFLSMSFVLLFVYTIEKRIPHKLRFFCLVAGVVILGALLLSESRAGLISVLCSIIVYYFATHIMCSGFRSVILTFTFSAIVIGGLYAYRTSSVDARIRIWKTSIKLAMEKPIFGHGFGSFTSVYMPFQKNILKACDEQTRSRADDVLSPYNQILLTFCESGCIGVLLTLAFVVSSVSSLWLTFRMEANVQLYLFVAYLVFGFFSYPSTEPALFLLIISVVANGIGHGSYRLDRYGTFVCNFKCAICAVSAFVCFSLCSIRIVVLQRVRLYCQSVSDSICSEQDWLKAMIFCDSRLLALCARAYVLSSDNDVAVPLLCREILYVNTSRQQLDLAKAYESLGEKDLAMQHYAEAHGMRPDLLEPIFAQFKLALPDSAQAFKLATFVVSTTPRVVNARTQSMKKEATRFMEEYKHFN